MINLLPPAEKIRIKKEENYRLIFIWGVFVLFFLISLSLVLFAVKTYIAGQVMCQSILVHLEEQKSQTMEAQNLEAEISLINHNLSKLVSFYKYQPETTELLEEITSVLPEEMYLSSLSLKPSQNGENKFQVSLTGYSPTREILLDFKNRLEEEEIFQGIYFPPSNWVKPLEINFSATFEMVI